MFISESRENFWVLNWLDEFMLGHNGFICGGCFKNIFNKEKVKDLDIFFESESDYEDAVQYFDSMTPGYEEADKRNEEYTFYYKNDNVKAYKHIRTGVRIELCSKIFGKPEEILKQFDFSITKFAYYKATIEDETGAEIEEEPIPVSEAIDTHIEYRVIYADNFFQHLQMKRLVTDGIIPYPMSTFERMLRYAKYGYFPCRETKMKIIKELRKLDDRQVSLSGNFYDGMD